ncbi:MAG: hypothetical protein ISR42_08480 [Acidimicrobiia bacterium]|nr:hypothetical protein [Acidimicrobiia bacterium]
MERLPIEVRVRRDLVIRGHEWPVERAPVVMLHDHGEDLDAWRGVDRALAEQGFRVISLELPGHGLSDGTPGEATVLGDVTELLGQVSEVWGPLGLCTYGRLAADLCALDGPSAPVAHIALSPYSQDAPDNKGRSLNTRVLHLIIAATSDGPRSEAARVVFDRLSAQKLWASVAAHSHGPDLLRSNPHLIDDICIFLRRYLVPRHLSWTATAHATAVSEFLEEESE